MSAVAEEKDATSQAVDLIQLVLAQICDDPKNLTVKVQTVGFTGTNIEIYADRTDYGNVLGTAGKILRGIKMMCKVFSDQTGRNINVTLMEKPGGMQQRKPRLKPQADWAREAVQGDLEEIFRVIFGECKVRISDYGYGESVVEVLVGGDYKTATAEWLQQEMSPMIQHIGSKHHRIRCTLTITVDEMLYDQTLTVEERESRHAPSWR